MSQIAFEYASLWILPIGLLAAGLTWLLYADARTNAQFQGKKRWLLATLRFLTLWIIGILLLSPFIKTSEKEIKKPFILIAEDVSESMRAVTDSGTRANYHRLLADLQEELEGDFAVELRPFGKELTTSGEDSTVRHATNLAAVFEKAYDELGAENLSAVVMLSDGIHNEGNDPGLALDRLKVPLYSVMAGDTTQKKDLRIANVLYNKIAYLQDKFTVQVDISAFNCLQESANLKVLDGKGSQVFQQAISIDKNDFFSTLSLTLDAKPAGLQKFRFELSVLKDEKNTSNNYREIYVEVLDARQKVLILAHAPHPDLAAWKQILELNQNYQVSVRLASNFTEPVQNYDLVVFHQLPSARFSVTNWIKELNERNTPRLFVVGSQTDLRSFNQSQSALQIKQGNATSNEVQGSLNPLFNAFVMEEVARAAIQEFNPMTAPFGEFIASPDADVLLYQRIGKIV